jgi:serine/threonine protein kinase
MNVVLQVGVLALQSFVDRACRSIGIDFGPQGVGVITRYLKERFTAHGDRLLAALGDANTKAWATLQFSLGGDSLLDRVLAPTAAADDRNFRDKLRRFLAAQKTAGVVEDDTSFRRQCLAQLVHARKEGFLRITPLDPRLLAEKAGRFAGYAGPTALLDAEHDALQDLAREFPGPQFGELRHLLCLKVQEESSLLAAAARHHFRRAVERDQALFQGLTFEIMNDVRERQEEGFDALRQLLERQGGRFDEVLDELGDQRRLIEQIDDGVQRLLQAMDARPLRLSDTLALQTPEERDAAREFIRRFRDLPQDQRRQLPELLNRIGKLEVVIGDFRAAERDFAEVAPLTDDPRLKAESQANRFQAALEAGDREAGLAALLEAARLDPARYAPFPLEKFEPLRLLGSGSFGIATLCRHRFHGGQVVVKTLLSGSLGRPAEELFAEAHRLNTLRHEAIVSLRDCGYAHSAGQSRPYFEMPYFGDETLESLVRTRGKLSPEDYLPLALKVVQALQAAHGQGIVHRDVKPSNLLVRRDPDGTWHVLVIDFGLAVARSVVDQYAHSRRGRSLIGSTIAGTRKYAAPEQMGDEDAEVGPWSDVYAFGRTSYFALLGDPEPDDDDKHTLPEGWRRLLSRCTAKKVSGGRRFQGFAEVLAELRNLGTQAPPPPRKPPAPAPVPDTPRPAASPSTGVLVHGEQVGPAHAVAFSPDGGRVLAGGKEEKLWLCDLNGGQQRHVGGLFGSVLAVCFVPGQGGQAVAAGADATPRLWDLEKGRMLRSFAGHTGPVHGVSVSPDGRLLTTGSADGTVRVWDLERGAELNRLEEHRGVVFAVAFSPDGRLLLSAGKDGTVRVWDVEKVRERGRLPRNPPKQIHSVFAAAWTPDGRFILSGGHDRLVHVWDVGRGGLVHSFKGHEASVRCVAVAEGGRLAATGGGDGTVRLWDLARRREVGCFKAHKASVRGVAFSPDGQRLLSGSLDGTVRLRKV